MTGPAGPVEAIFGHAGEQADCFRVDRIPRLPRELMLGQLTAPLVAAYQLGAKVFAHWTHEPFGPFTVHVGGTHGFPSWVDGGAGPGGLVFPPGARAVRCGRAVDALGARLGATPCWMRLGALVAPDGDGAAITEVLEDHASFLADRAFDLLTIALPVSAADIDRARSRVTAAIFGTEQRLERGAANLAVAQLRAQLAEYTAASATGLWRVHALVGGPDADTVRQVAALWSAATAPYGPVPYRLAPVGVVGDLRATLASSHPGPAAHGTDAVPGAELSGPFTTGGPMLAALCRPPVREVPGVPARATNPFDVAAPAPGEPDAEVPFGQVLDAASRPVGTLTVPLRSLGLHTFVHGATGAGKSQTTRHLLTELSRRGIPWVVLEPAKSEYATGMQERLDRIRDELPDPALAEVHVIRPGDPDATGVCLPPLAPEPGAHYQAHLDALVDLTVAAFDAESPFPEVLAQAVDVAVRESGWDPALSRPLRAVAGRYPAGAQPAYADIEDLVRCCHQVIDAKGYGPEVAGNVHGFVDMRLGTLTTGTKRTAFGAGYPLSMRRLLRRNVVLELQDLGTDGDRAMFMGLFLSRLSQAVRLRHRDDPASGVRNVVCVEEAHRLLRNPDGLSAAAARAVGSFTDLLAEVRSQGVALIVAEQIPAKLAPDVVKNTAVKCMGRTPAADDRALVGAAIGLDEEQSREVVTLPAGTFAVHADGYDAPVLVRFPYVPETAGARPHDPAPLADPLPSWFGPVAQPGALTQRDLAWAAECTQDRRLITLCELTVAAYLSHRAGPRPDSGWRERLLAPFRTGTPAADGSSGAPAVDAAVGMLVGQAVRARRPVLGAYPAESLCTAVAADVRAALASGPAPAAAPDPRWRSRPHQWLALRAELARHPDDDPAHPETGRWRSWGVDYVDGATIREQRITLLSSVLHGRDDVAAALFGVRRPGALERAVHADGLAFAPGLDHLLRAFVNRPELDPLMRLLLRHRAPLAAERHRRSEGTR
ncbi:ATP-binding protein [Mangrovihabitans endophyticus]|uniref:DNA helicase HerA, contains HAS-barrel and ATPase domains n=1 Tax=Mangrovihabitans endophyticus TaxID=1751298 RepID=A0A8J3C7V3_9ACTN|nr:type IV secretion system DNA-binding domain-containing protein [Mangrovihabitans endophyticus]GGL20129.1 hypothetical protein GCM10012284_63430 [Mangrovihabitans endophyticus]